ncbi:MAG: DUF1801 domain-containing protein [Actinomycetota bacterium]|nr:DUF1801 domain-containing protein [Actinomycetota bacterium]
MAKYVNKTKPETVPVEEFLESVADPVKRADSDRLIELMSKATGEPATMWGPSIIGFGQYHYRSGAGTEGDTALVGFSPRKGAISLYTITDADTRADLLGRLGKHKAAVGCIYVKKLSDVDEAVLAELIEKSVAFTRSQHVEP